MDLIIKGRCRGKTTDLVRLSHATSIPIVSLYPGYVKYVAKDLNLSIPEPMCITHYIKNYKGQPAYFDNLDRLLACIGLNVDTATLTVGNTP